MSERGQQMVAVAVMVAIVAGVGVAWVTRGSGAEPEPVATAVMTPGPEPTTEPEPTATASEVEASETEEAEPTPTPSPSVPAVPEGQTVLFRGGPAEGPWRTIGSVAEITHPDAAPGSTFGYLNFWTDPAEENQPDWLWDQITAEVALQAIDLGTPVDRPTFDGEELSEGFNAFGGIQDIYFDDEVFTATWKAIYEDEAGVAAAFWVYVVAFDETIVHRADPLIIREEDVADFSERTDLAVEWTRSVASSLGYEL